MVWSCMVFQNWKSNQRERTRKMTEHTDALPGHTDEDEASHMKSCKRMGRFLPDRKKPRPVLLMFSSLDEKHKLLKMSQRMRERGLRLDDWLTEVQQQEKSRPNTDQMLREKEYKPFFRGSVLMYRSSEKACVCLKGKADTVLPAA